MSGINVFGISISYSLILLRVIDDSRISKSSTQLDASECLKKCKQSIF